MAYQDQLIHRCNVVLQASLIDEAGGVVRDPRALVKSDVPCLVSPLGGASDGRQGRAAQTASHRVYFDGRQGLDRRHAILWGERVLMVRSEVDANGMGIVVAYDCEEVVV